MPLSLTNDQELTTCFKKLKDISDSIPETFFRSFLDDKLCDEPSNRVKVKDHSIGIFGRLSKIDATEEQKNVVLFCKKCLKL